MAVSDTTSFITEEPTTDVETIDGVVTEEINEKELAERLLAQAREQGVSLVGPGGLLSSLTKTVLERALEAEMVERWCQAASTSSRRAWLLPALMIGP